jgi:uncharacterized protein (TIGR02246 family)
MKVWGGVVAIATLAVSLLVVACVSTGPTNEAAEMETIAQSFTKRAEMFTKPDVQGLIDFWCDDGINLAQGKAPVTGKEKLAEMMRANFAANVFSNRVHEIKEVRVFNDQWAMMWGLYHDDRTPKAGGPTTKYYGKVLLILRKEADGKWHKYIDIANDDAPPK